MEIVDANAGLLSNFEVFQWLTDKNKNNYPSYADWQHAVDIQRDREYQSSFLSSKDAKKLYEQEQAEVELEKHNQMQDTHTNGNATSAAAASSSDSAAAASSSSSSSSSASSLSKRDLKPLEGTCWLRSRVHEYLLATPAATQSSSSIASFLMESKSLLQARAAENRVKEEETRLTVCELIQLINLRPTSLVEIHRAIEECEERLTEEDTLALLELIDRTLPKAPPRAGAAQVADVEEDSGQTMEE